MSISTKQLSYDKKGTFVGFVSDFGPDFDLERFDDLDCHGITVVSHVTGAEKKFLFVGHMKDREGDFVGWRLEADCGILKLNVFNT